MSASESNEKKTGEHQDAHQQAVTTDHDNSADVNSNARHPEGMKHKTSSSTVSDRQEGSTTIVQQPKENSKSPQSPPVAANNTSKESPKSHQQHPSAVDEAPITKLPPAVLLHNKQATPLLSPQSSPLSPRGGHPMHQRLSFDPKNVVCLSCRKTFSIATSQSFISPSLQHATSSNKSKRGRTNAFIGSLPMSTAGNMSPSKSNATLETGVEPHISSFSQTFHSPPTLIDPFQWTEASTKPTQVSFFARQPTVPNGKEKSREKRSIAELREMQQQAQVSPVKVRPTSPALESPSGESDPSAHQDSQKKKTLEACQNLLNRLCESVAEYDFPLCIKCWKNMLSKEKTSLEEMNEHTESMRAFLAPSAQALAVSCRLDLEAEGEQRRKLEGNRASSKNDKIKNDTSGPDEELQAILEEEQNLEAELAALDLEFNKEKTKENELLQHEAQLKTLEEQSSGKINDVLAMELLSRNEEESMENQLELTKKRLSRLMNYNTLAEVFAIRTGGGSGTVSNNSYDKSPSTLHNAPRLTPSFQSSSSCGEINKLRVRKIPKDVPILEINCGCAYLLQLLQLLTVRHNITLSRYQLCCLGVESIIEVTVPKKQKLDFFITQKFFSWRTFGPACVAYCTCVKEVATHLTKAIQKLKTDTEKELENAISSEMKSVENSPKENESRQNDPSSKHQGGEAETPAKQQVGNGSVGNISQSIGGYSLVVESEERPPCGTHEFVDYLGSLSAQPHPIEGPSCGGFSVQYSDTSDETWTKGMKNVMENLQWCLKCDAAIDAAKRRNKIGKRKSEKG